MILLNQAFHPLIRVKTPEINIFALQKEIENYIHDNHQIVHYQGTLSKAFPITGQVRDHVLALTDRLNHSGEFPYRFEMKQGFFIDGEIEHYWTQSGDLLIDICIQQFRNFPFLRDNPLINIANYTYFICDNPLDQLYQLYIEDIL